MYPRCPLPNANRVSPSLPLHNSEKVTKDRFKTGSSRKGVLLYGLYNVKTNDSVVHTEQMIDSHFMI